jgi:hypothetical protein
MKKILLILLAAVSLSACTNYGKKIKVDGTKGEVFYKGDGVTEADAKKTGEFLKTQNYFTTDKGASVQISKEGEAYTMRFVYNKDVYDSLKGVEDAFKIIAVKASKELFGGKKVNIALANKTFEDFKTIPYDEATAKSMEEPKPSDDETVLKKEDYDHDAAGDVDFYWNGISDEESKKIADYIVKNGAFNGGTAEIYMTKDGDRYILKFPMIESARTDAAILASVEKVSKEIKDNVFADRPYSFFVTDENMNTVKSWDY